MQDEKPFVSKQQEEIVEEEMQPMNKSETRGRSEPRKKKSKR
jgi:hypothetical protein